MGGALIVVGEDYGEGASVIQERTHAYAMKSHARAARPAARLANTVRMVEKALNSRGLPTPRSSWSCEFARAMSGADSDEDNLAPKISPPAAKEEPAAFLDERLAHPPATFRQEKLKYEGADAGGAAVHRRRGPQ